MSRPSVLFVHDRFPGQFGSWGAWLLRRGWAVAFAARHPPEAGPPGLRIVPYAPHRAPSPATHPYAQPMDRAALQAQGFARAALRARREGLRPDVVVSHAGWGGGTFARDVFPRAAHVAYAEWWYNHPGPDTAFLAGLGGQPPEPVEAPMHERARNAPQAIELLAADLAVCPTRFQADQFPPRLREGMRVMHDGIDTGFFRPAPLHPDPTLGGRVGARAPVVTFATRGMEPHRGFPQVMAALPSVLAARPDAVAVVAGDNLVAYGGEGARGVDWRARALAAHDLDPARVLFVGTLGRGAYRRLLQRSDAHVYLTVPFVLSWSMLEAMSVGAPLVLSDTAPVREFAGPEEAALVRFEAADVARGVLEALGEPQPRRRAAARARVREAARAARELPRKERLLLEVA